MQFIDSTTPAAPKPPGPSPTGPGMPWGVREVAGFGSAVFRCKHYASTGITGDILSAEDEQIVAYVACLERENVRLKEQLAGANATTTNAANANPPTPNATPTPGEVGVPITSNAAPAVGEPEAPPGGEEVAGSKRQRAEEELLKAPGDSNGALAKRIGASDELVRKVRKELESSGKLPSPPA